jgi:hypothetical protein
MRALLTQDPPAEIVVAPEPATRRWWPLAGACVGLALVVVVALIVWGRWPGIVMTATPTPIVPTALASPIVTLLPTAQPTVVVQASTPTQLVAPSPTAVQADTPTPSITPSPTDSAPTPALPSIAAVQPTELYTGAIPAQITLTGTNLGQVSSARLFSQERAPIDLTIATQTPDQLVLVIAGLSESVVGEIPYQIELNGQILQQSVALRDFIAVATVTGVRLNYIYTGRVARGAAGAITGMRERADRDSGRIGQLENGDQVQILQNTPTGWYQVRVAQSSDPTSQNQVGWIEQWLVDDTNVPPQKFVGRLGKVDIDKAITCGTRFESSIYGRVEDVFGNAIAGATIRVVSSDGRNRFTKRTIANGLYAVPGLGCTTWIVTLIGVPNQQPSFSAAPITVRNLNGGNLTAAEVRFRIAMP